MKMNRYTLCMAAAALFAVLALTGCFPLWIYLCGKGISAQTGGASAYCKQSLHLRSACTIFAAKSGLWPEKKQITP